MVWGIVNWIGFLISLEIILEKLGLKNWLFKVFEALINFRFYFESNDLIVDDVIEFQSWAAKKTGHF